MSKFEILTSRGGSLRTLGLVNKMIYTLIAIILPLLVFSATIINRLNISDAAFMVLIALWVFSVISLVIYTRLIKANLQKLGEMEVTLNGIKKTIGGFETVFGFEKIRQITVRNHLRSIIFHSANDSSKTYLVSITVGDGASERFIVASQSVTKPEVNFLESLKFVEKYKNMNLRITRYNDIFSKLNTQHKV